MLAPHSTLLSGIFFNSTEQFRDVVNSREVRALLRFSFAGEQLAAQFANPSHHRSTNRMRKSTAGFHGGKADFLNAGCHVYRVSKIFRPLPPFHLAVQPPFVFPT